MASYSMKGRTAPITEFRPLCLDAALMARELAEQARRSPGMFRNCLVQLDLETVAQDAGDLDLGLLVAAMRTLGMLPVLLKGAGPELAARAEFLGLGLSGAQPQRPADSGQAQTVLQQHVRSGQRVYGKGGDLIVFGAVNPGAEVLADGNIHIYGPLRGRALAGVLGNAQARIFCQLFHAEFLSVAGLYRTSDSFAAELDGRPVQVFLEGERMVMEPMA